jgi:adenine phosphoribosyltransferase
VQRSSGTIVGAAFIIDLPELGGRKRLEEMGVRCETLMAFEGH